MQKGHVDLPTLFVYPDHDDHKFVPPYTHQGFPNGHRNPGFGPPTSTATSPSAQKQLIENLHSLQQEVAKTHGLTYEEIANKIEQKYRRTLDGRAGRSIFGRRQQKHHYRKPIC